MNQATDVTMRVRLVCGSVLGIVGVVAGLVVQASFLDVVMFGGGAGFLLGATADLWIRRGGGLMRRVARCMSSAE